MKERLFVLAVSALFFSTPACRKCYDCTVDTLEGDVTRTICGRKKEVQPLLDHLESDTTGYGPWTCQ